MSSNPQDATVDRDTALRLRYMQLRFPDHEDRKDNGTLNSNLLDYKTSTHDSFDVQDDTELSEECLYASEDEDSDLYMGQDPEELNEIIASVDNESAAQSHDGSIFSGAEVEKIGECFKHVINKCKSGSSSGNCSSRAGDVLQRSVELATRMAKSNEVQQGVLRLAGSDSSFMRHVDELGEDIDALKTPISLIRGRRSEVRRSTSSNEDFLGKDPWSIRFVDALCHLCKQLGRLGAQAINLIINKIMACFNVAKDICLKICRIVMKGFLWIVKCITNPQQEINKLLNDPEKRDWEKVLGISLVLLVGILWIIFSRKARTILTALGASFFAYLLSTPRPKARKV